MRKHGDGDSRRHVDAFRLQLLVETLEMLRSGSVVSTERVERLQLAVLHSYKAGRGHSRAEEERGVLEFSGLLDSDEEVVLLGGTI
jgi:hypothetical protein